VPGLFGLVARSAHVPFGADTQLCGTTCSIEDEVHTLSLTQHAKNGALECMRSKLVLDEIRIAQDDAVASGRIERLDHALHESKSYHR